MQEVVWKDGIATLAKENVFNLFLTHKNQHLIIPYVPLQTSRILVGISTNSANDDSSIHTLFQNKMDQPVGTILPSN